MLTVVILLALAVLAVALLSAWVAVKQQTTIRKQVEAQERTNVRLLAAALTFHPDERSKLAQGLVHDLREKPAVKPPPAEPEKKEGVVFREGPDLQ